MAKSLASNLLKIVWSANLAKVHSDWSKIRVTASRLGKRLRVVILPRRDEVFSCHPSCEIEKNRLMRKKAEISQMDSIEIKGCERLFQTKKRARFRRTAPLFILKFSTIPVFFWKSSFLKAAKQGGWVFVCARTPSQRVSKLLRLKIKWPRGVQEIGGTTH